MNFILLPTELIVEVFKYLSIDGIDQLYILENVCKLFKTIIHNYPWISVIDYNTSNVAISRSFFKYKFNKLTVCNNLKKPLSFFMKANDIIIKCYDSSSQNITNKIINKTQNILIQNNCQSIIVWQMEKSNISVTLLYHNKNESIASNNHQCLICAHNTYLPPVSNNKSIIAYKNNTNYFENIVGLIVNFIQCIHHYKKYMISPDQHIVDRWEPIRQYHMPIYVNVTKCNYNITFVKDDGLSGLRFA